jgi:serine/threonine protein phosphatase PrpC
LFKSFIDTDIEFLDAPSGNPSGSTANVMLWDQSTGYAYIANTADTRAVLCRSGEALDLSIDRKASDPEEIARIAESGGFIVKGRVQGSLAVSRALGVYVYACLYVYIYILLSRGVYFVFASVCFYTYIYICKYL